MKFLQKYNKYILIGITIIALSGTLFPLASVSIQFFGTTTFNFGLVDVLRNLSGEPPHEIIDLIADNFLESDISMHIILPFVAYILAIILLIITLPLTFTNRFKMVKIAFVSMSISLIIYAGIGINALPGLLIRYLERNLADLIGEIAGFFINDFAGFLIGGFAGFLTSLVDFSNILDINLGLGYWITLGTLLVLLILLIITKIIERTQKKVRY